MVGLFAFYLVGILVRQQFGIGITIHNDSDGPLQKIRVRVERQGTSYGVPDLLPGKRGHIFVKPVTESHINLEYVDSNHQPHTELLVGYVEADYCGSATITILPEGKTLSRENIDLIACWKSWLDFW